MKNINMSYSLLLGFFILVLIQACNTPDVDVIPNKSKSDNLSLVLKSLEGSLSAQESEQANTAIRNLTFEEEERFNQIRYDKALEFADADVSEVNYWREWSCQANQIAYRRTGKGYLSLKEDEMQAVVKEIQLTSPSDEVKSSSSANGRVSATTSTCQPWNRDKHLLPILAWQLVEGKRLVRFSSVLRVNNAGTSKDCDYVFQFRIDRVDRPYGIIVRGPSGNFAFGLTESQVAVKTIDAAPTSDCGYYILQVLVGARRIQKAFGANPNNAKLEIAVIRQPRQKPSQPGWCWTGERGSERWYLSGVYQRQWDNYPGAGWPQCASSSCGNSR